MDSWATPKVLTASYIHADDTAGCSAAQDAVGGAAAMAELGMGCWNGTSSAPNRQACPRSQHPGGIYVAFVDGSVHWIGDFIETQSDAGSVWDRLNMADDGLSVDVSKF